uniref:Coiled-coil and C2 domain containing 1B n=1 Tax=Catharus ustulatus TaxID=91951 RepID=A0A8C3TUK2_CATUS
SFDVLWNVLPQESDNPYYHMLITLGLFVDFNPEEMLLGAEEGEDDGDLEAELAAITGAKVKEGKPKPKVKAPLPMDHIEKMAAECLCTGLLWYLDTFHYCRAAVCGGTLETMLAAVKKGKKISEEEMPPPVATGKHSYVPQAMGMEVENSGDSPENKVESAANDEQKASPEEREHLESESLQGRAHCLILPDPQHSNTRAILLMRQKEYKLAALKAKQQGDLEKAKEYMRAGKKFNVVLEALDNGQPIDLQNMPPSPQGKACLQENFSEAACVFYDLYDVAFNSVWFAEALQQPKTVLEALQQRLEKYRAAAAQAKASGDDRKSRMHDRIAKQYQDAIRAHKAGRKVNFSELPVPPGFPPLPGVASTDGGSTIAAVLENASKLANMEENDEEEEEVMFLYNCFSVREQLEFLESRKKQYLKAAIKAKRENNLEQAKTYLRTAKGLDLKIEQAKSGKTVDISKLPSPPTDDEGDFIFVHHEDVRLSQKADEVYAQLVKLLKDQHERCLQYSKQFMHLGNVAETTRFEKLAQGCKKDMEILQLARAQGMDPPSHHFEERTFKMIRIFSDLNSTEMHLLIVRGINLPAPPGHCTPLTPSSLPLSLVSLTEYNQLFKLNINRNHRGFRRAIRSKGIKFEVFHKGSFFRSDKHVGTAHLKLDKLESECEVREIIEIFDGRKPTGGKLEVKVRLREPLSGQDLQTVTENWLVLER